VKFPRATYQKVPEMPDITCVTPDGRLLWLEYEHPDTHSTGAITEKQTKQMRHCDIWKCVYQRANRDVVTTAVGEFAISRGKALTIFISQLCISPNESRNSAAEQIEA
jgi:hypothetical protein